ncbi:MAG: phosphoribosylglycinamide formyltransferase [Thiotrichaceae bacterium]
MKKLGIVILISGRGSNMQAIVEAHDPLVEIRAVISNRADAAGLIFAQQQGIATDILDHKQFPTREAFDHALIARIDQYSPHLLVLAGFMRILTPEFVTHYAGRLINIHPSLLPKYKGLHTHARVLEAGEMEHGATVHFVTADLDAGATILQAQVPVLPTDDEATLAARVLEQEHQIYPRVIHWFAEGKLPLQGFSHA